MGAASAPGARPLLQDDAGLAQQFQQRLSGVSYGKHTPRINSVDLSANPEASMTDRELLRHRLELYQLCERRVKGDGNCQVLLSL